MSQITKQVKTDAMQGALNCYKNADWFKSQWFKKVYDEVEPFKKENVEGYYGYNNIEPKKLHINITGSNDPKDWKFNMDFWLEKMHIKGNPYELTTPYGGMENKSEIKAHRGIILCYKIMRDIWLKKCQEFKSVEIKGHSLGGGLTIHLAVDLQKNKIFDSKNIVAFPFSAPRVFNQPGAESYDRRVPNTWLYWYCNDIVVKNLFQWFVGHRHVGHWLENQVGKPHMLIPWNWILAITGWHGDHWPHKLLNRMKKEL